MCSCCLHIHFPKHFIGKNIGCLSACGRSELGCWCWLGCVSQCLLHNLLLIICLCCHHIETMVKVLFQRKRDDNHWRQRWRRINLCYSATRFLIKRPVSESSVTAVFSLITHSLETMHLLQFAHLLRVGFECQ